MGDDELRARLLLERIITADQVASLGREFDDIVASTELVATDDEHDPEGHTIAFERQQVAALRQAARSHLAALDDALAGLELGDYGRCERCRQPIAAERLEALPAARTCISCAS